MKWTDEQLDDYLDLCKYLSWQSICEIIEVAMFGYGGCAKCRWNGCSKCNPQQAMERRLADAELILPRREADITMNAMGIEVGLGKFCFKKPLN